MIDVYYYDKALFKGELKDIEKYKGKNIWVDISEITKEESESVKEAFNLHPLTSEDLVNSPIRVKVEEFDEYLFCVYYGILKKESLEMLEIDFVLGKKFLVTNHAKKNPLIESLKSNEKKLSSLLSKGPDFLFHKILDKEVDNFPPILEDIDELIEDYEEKATDNPDKDLLANIVTLKRQLVQLRKMTLAQREKISFLAKNDYAHISKKAIPYFRDVYDHFIRVSDMVDSQREAIGSVFEAYRSSVANNMNEVMKVLSIIATIALPLTVVSGIYGTNFGTLPGEDFVYGFWVMIFIMVLMSVVMIYMFKKKSWI